MLGLSAHIWENIGNYFNDQARQQEELYQEEQQYNAPSTLGGSLGSYITTQPYSNMQQNAMPLDASLSQTQSNFGSEPSASGMYSGTLQQRPGQDPGFMQWMQEQEQRKRNLTNY